jgi:hypothetical protein
MPIGLYYSFPREESTTMTDKELKNLRRSDLLEMLLTVSRENDQLREELEQTRKQLQERNLAISEAGSMAEAVLRLNGVFDAAEAACKQYEENIRSRCDKMEQDTRKKCEAILLAVKKQAARVIQTDTTGRDDK